MTPSFEVFCQKTKEGNLIPVYQEILADTETPVSAFLKMRADAPEDTPIYLLESVEGGEKWGRYSFLGIHPALLIKSFGNEVEVIEDNTCQRLSGENPFHVLKKTLARFRPVVVEALPRFWGGAVGFISYEGSRFFEPSKTGVASSESHATDKVPDFFFMISDTLLIFDHRAHTLKIVSYAFIEGDNIRDPYEKAVQKINACRRCLERPLETSSDLLTVSAVRETSGGDLPLSNMTQASFYDAVQKAKEYIRAGDIFQVQISQCFSTPLQCDPFRVYRALRRINPSSYMYYFQAGSLHVVGTSPEVLVRLEGRKITTRPIAGTRRRGVTEQEDQQLESELLSDPKERAEHIMLVDLSRNDIGRVSEYGSVSVDESMIIERYSHVMHIVSNVTGQLKETEDAFSLLAACFPAGTVSGAPKIRAMEIIDALEPNRRGLYAGAVGYFGFDGNMDTCITIRTIIIHDHKMYVQAAAGIVADSNPDQEYKETLNKARVMLEAIALATKGTL